MADMHTLTNDRFYATKLVRNILSRGLCISVDNGEEDPSFPSRNEDTILGLLNATEMETLRLYKHTPGGLQYVGFFFLVWGNCPSGEELVSDHSGNRLCDNIWSDVFGREPVA